MSQEVLIVDASRSFAKYLEVVFTRLGNRVCAAGNGREALQILKGRVPDLILTETVLPDMSGAELAGLLKEHPRTDRIPLVAVTVDGRAAEQNDLFAEVATKPITVRDLFHLLQRHSPYRKRRRNVRAPLAARVGLRNGVQHRSYVTLSVGEGGMFVETEEPRTTGTILDLDLFLPGQAHPLTVRAQVVYKVPERRGSLPPGMGMKFVDLDRETRSELTRFMEDYLEGKVKA